MKNYSENEVRDVLSKIINGDKLDNFEIRIIKALHEYFETEIPEIKYLQHLNNSIQEDYDDKESDFNELEEKFAEFKKESEETIKELKGQLEHCEHCLEECKVVN